MTWPALAFFGLVHLDLPHDLFKVARGGDQLEDSLAGGTVETGFSALELDVEPDRIAGSELEPGERNSHLEDRAGRGFDGGAVGYHASIMIQVADWLATIRLQDDDLAAGRLDKADPEAVGVAQNVACRPSLGVDANEQSRGVESEPDRFEHSAGNLTHGSAFVAAGVMGRVDPFKISCPAVDLDVRKAAGLSVGRPRRGSARNRIEERPGRVESQQGIHVAQMLAEQMIEEPVERARVVVAIPPEPVRSLGDVDFVPGPFEGGGFVPQGALFGQPGMIVRHGVHPTPGCLRGGRPRSRSCG